MSSHNEKPTYHHGDLQRAILDAGISAVRDGGSARLSLRQIATVLGVSTPALYHHYRNKDALLLGIADESLQRLTNRLEACLANGGSAEALALTYVHFACHEPHLYELIFQRELWHMPHTEPFHLRAKQQIRRFSGLLSELQAGGQLPAHADPLRLAQVAWATLHGLCLMYNQGLDFSANTIEDIAKHAVALLKRAL